MLCQYKNIFGKPNTGVHKYRIFNIAIVDVILTMIFAYLIYLALPKYNYFCILFFLFLLGIFFHRLFCVRTTIDKLLFP
jgi:hypothetical protein|uniref:RDD domain-containing protein n=1 Tax=viral metagenome TaxID=1070528 RepID=A0A6C0CK86_9ZZZZ